MNGRFELFVAGRYLRARRKEKVISVITVISVIGVAAGVMALIVSLAVNNGFRNTLQRNMLAATAHVNILEKVNPGVGITDYHSLLRKLARVPHVVAVAPVLYDPVLVRGPRGDKLITLKGIDTRAELATSDTLRHLKQGSLAPNEGSLPSIIIGVKLAQDIGVFQNSVVTVIDPQASLTPFSAGPRVQRYRVTGIFETDFFDVDDTWAYAPLAEVQSMMSSGDVVNTIEMRLDNPDLAPEVGREAERLVGPEYSALTWEEQNKALFEALKLERAGFAVAIGLIELVGGLNILITLTMIVLTKYKDIAVMMSMGARRSQIRSIFIMQGIMIGVIGTILGLVAGYSLCYFADKYRLVHLDESVYALSYVPFDPRPWDGLWIAAAALLICLLATIYPARNATRITPVEVLRYE